MSDDAKWMQRALELAAFAEKQGEVPVGAVIVLDNEIIGEGWNQPILSSDATAHAEIIALRQACERMQNYRIPGADMYITLEPCVMCAGGLVHARINRLIFASKEPKTGAAGSCVDVFNLPNLNHRVQCESGLLAEQSSDMLRRFFRARR
ncbi:tRNA adenosine(34) deaminase TadA [Methylophaga sp.]|uniref:tRNA adenosine(34) deaminase TadA n=1 Tax=Methylophaga sp. TaxID=2024840 RepID=UPI003F6A1A47